jgi:hypothetical protein
VTLLDLDMRPALQVLATRLTYLPSRLFLYELNNMILIGQRTPDDSGLYYTQLEGGPLFETTTGCANP